MPLPKKAGPKALKTAEKWGCKKIPCPFYHSTPLMRRTQGWKEQHEH